MRLQILGAAAGGRFPQWNCGCRNCTAVRRGTFAGKPRTQSQLALSADNTHWFLAGTSPDVASQIEGAPELQPRELRDSPLAGVVLSSADLDHVLGLLLLRELQPLRVYATSSVLKILRDENTMFGMLNRVEPQVVWTEISKSKPFPLTTADGSDSGLQCEAVFLSGRYPKYVKTSGLARDEAVCGLIFSSDSGKRIAYFPAVAALTGELLAKINGVDLLLFDGTFWSDDELQRALGSGETARQMGHIPVEESLRKLSGITAARKMFIHINNTNPMLNEAGPEFRTVQQAGWEIAEDRWRVDL